MKYSEEISNRLNELIEKNMNAKDGYAKAIEMIEDNQIKEFFDNRATERAKFVKELRSKVWQNGEIPENSGNVIGEFHRSWMSLKTALSSNNEEAVLEEVIRGEKSSLEEYNEIISSNVFPSEISSVLKSQRDAIEKTIEKAKKFETVVS